MNGTGLFKTDLTKTVKAPKFLYSEGSVNSAFHADRRAFG